MTDSKCILEEELREVTEKIGTFKLDELLGKAAEDITKDLGHYLSWGRVSPVEQRTSLKSKKVRTEAYRSFEVVLRSQISEMLKKELQK